MRQAVAEADAWNTKPIRLRRSLVRSFSARRVRSTPSIQTLPDVSVSRPARQCISVLLPEPEGPMIAVNWPAAKSTVTPARACTSVSPVP